MTTTHRLLVVHHSPTRSLRVLTDAVVAGAHDAQVEGVDVLVRQALEASADDVLWADGYLLGTPANFGYMSGALKHFFDSTFLAVGGALSPTGAPSESPRRSALSPATSSRWARCVRGRAGSPRSPRR